MNSRLSSIDARQLIKVLKKIGFAERRQTGSHLILRHPETGKIIPVPIHKNKDLKKGTLRSILKTANLSVKEFKKLLK